LSADTKLVWVECTHDGGTTPFHTCDYSVPLPLDVRNFQMPSTEHFVGMAKTDLTNMGLARPPYGDIKFRVRFGS
jgi:hypothetical protein